MYSTSELDELFQILNSIKGFKLDNHKGATQHKVLHTLWNGVDIIMNQELVSTTNQKYMYKAYIESVLNNSASTKKYQLEMQGFYGDQGDKDQDFRQTFNPGMTPRYMQFKDDKKVQLMGFLHSNIIGIQGSIVNGVEININLLITCACRFLTKYIWSTYS